MAGRLSRHHASPGAGRAGTHQARNAGRCQMKVLFDVNTPRPLRQELPGHEVITAQAMGWGELENGDWIDAADEAELGALVTADRNLLSQQTLSGRRLG